MCTKHFLRHIDGFLRRACMQVGLILQCAPLRTSSALRDKVPVRRSLGAALEHAQLLVLGCERERKVVRLLRQAVALLLQLYSLKIAVRHVMFERAYTLLPCPHVGLESRFHLVTLSLAAIKFGIQCVASRFSLLAFRLQRMVLR